MSDVIDINAMVTSVYNTIISLQTSITKTMGVDVYYCRALPYQNSEDVIVQEYTLSNVECPKQIKLITNNTGYQAGNFSVDLWGVAFDTPLEMSVDIATWESTYGKDTMPQKGDIVVMPMLHRIFQVTSSTVVNSMATLPTSYKLQLGKYQRMASRRESEEVQVSIDELTTSQQEMFGDAISKEVADTVIEVETSYNESTMVDPIKTFDMDSIVPESVIGSKNQIISESYYSFATASKPIIYNIDATYDVNSKENNLIYTCWFKIDKDAVAGIPVQIVDVKLKERSYWYFHIKTKLRLSVGDKVTISRGKLLNVRGVIDDDMCDDMLTFKVETSEVLQAQKRLPNWWSRQGVWQIKKQVEYNLFSAYNGDDCVIDYSIDEQGLNFTFGEVKKSIQINNLQNGEWTYMALQVSPKAVRYVLTQDVYNDLNGERTNVLIVDDKANISTKNVSFDTASIENVGNSMYMCNIRLYENEYDMEDTWKLDMYSEVTRNASKLILVDVPRPANKMDFHSIIK